MLLIHWLKERAADSTSCPGAAFSLARNLHDDEGLNAVIDTCPKVLC